MSSTRWVPLRAAWDAALYGPTGFYRRHRPVDHFRTSAHASPLFAEAVAALAHRHRLTTVWDFGAGDGALLRALHAHAPDLHLVGVDIGRRPDPLPEEIGWQHDLPRRCDGLVIANELLDNIPCDVVELDASRCCRVVEVLSSTGDERLGEPAPAPVVEWLATWWPLTEIGQRAEVGLARESLWARVCAAMSAGICVAVDYGHLRRNRPCGGSLSSYRKGVQTSVTYDGEHDVTAHVAFDALAAAVGGEVRLQRDMLHDLGVTGARPPLGAAATDPAGYLRALTRATEAAELTQAGGLGDFCWLVTRVGT